MHGSFPVSIASSDEARERLAKEWLLALVERTPLGELGELAIGQLSNEAPALVAAIGEALGDPGEAAEGEVVERARAGQLAGLRGGGAAARVYEDLGELQVLCVRMLEREHGDEEPSVPALAAERLARLFGSIHEAVALELADAGHGIADAGRGLAEIDSTTGLEGLDGLQRFLSLLLAEQRRYGHPFAVALVDVDGLGHVNEAYGREAGDRMLLSVASTLRGQVREVDRAFRLPDDEFAIVAPHTEADGLAVMAERVAAANAAAQSATGPRIAIAVGVVDCPTHGLNAERLLESATEAIYAAKASGAAVAHGQAVEGRMQDP